MRRITELPALPGRNADGHKGSFGRVLVIAGSRGMSGAAVLTGVAALRSGAGLVFVAAPASIVPVIAASEPSLITVPLPEDDAGRLTEAAFDALADQIKAADSVAVGPGWGQSDSLRQLATRLFDELPGPAIFDADALNALAPMSPADHSANTARPPRVFTPHPGEFARLLGTTIADVQSQRETAAFDFAALHKLVLLLKGPSTVMTDGDRLAVNQTGNSGMATGGSGDVLTGVIAALLAQKMDAFAAARLGAHVHGTAGDLAAAELTQVGMISSDLLQYLPRAWQTLGAS